MARPKRNFGDHTIVWNPDTNSFLIKPRYPNASITPHFGLGDALVTLNLSNLPEEIIVPITGETTKSGISPTSPFGLKRWFGMPSNISTISKVLTGFDGWTETVHYPQAGGGSVKQVTATDIIQNGYGSEEIVGTPLRLNW